MTCLSAWTLPREDVDACIRARRRFRVEFGMVTVTAVRCWMRTCSRRALNAVKGTIGGIDRIPTAIDSAYSECGDVQ